MKTAKRFKIVPFTNPSGDKVYRVSGTLDGKTIRKNFKSKSDGQTRLDRTHPRPEPRCNCGGQPAQKSEVQQVADPLPSAT